MLVVSRPVLTLTQRAVLTAALLMMPTLRELVRWVLARPWLIEAVLHG